MPHSPSKLFALPGALAIVLSTASCTGEPAGNEANVVNETRPAPKEDLPLPETALDRDGLLVTMLEASSAAIIGADDAAAQADLKGRRFEVRMRFGCPSARPEVERSWSYSEASGALRVTVKPDIDAEAPTPAAAVDGGKVPVVRERGFLIPAPTVLANGCPTSDYAAVAGFTNLRFGIVQRSDPQANRAGQLLESYEIVKKIAPEAVPTDGLDLIVRGRLETAADGRAIRCSPRGGVVECFANATIDHVGIEDPVRSQLVAEWDSR